jgi:glycerophosphoryl diester phosphodiesterase
MTLLHAPGASPNPDAVPRFTGIEAILLDAGDILYNRPERGGVLAAFLDRHAGGRKPDKAEVKTLKIAAWRGHAGRLDYYRAMLGTAGITDPAVLDEGAHMLEAEQHRVTFLPGVARGLHALRRAGFRLGIITNTHETTEEKLDWFAAVGIDAIWDVFVNSCETGFVKPEPEIYRLALDRLGLRPDQAVFVGHSAKEIAGARSVGMPTAAFNPDTPDIGADASLDRLEQLLTFATPGNAAAARAKGPRLGPAGLPMIAAHRGGALLWPENSMQAFRGALALHSDMIETDIHLSADGIPVILHDATLDRTTHGSGPVSAQTAAELAAIRLRDTEGETVAPLAALLPLIDASDTDLRLEIKIGHDGNRYPGIEAAALALLDQHGLLPRTTLSSFDLATLADIARIARPANLIALVRSDEVDRLGTEAILSRIAALGLPEIAFTARLVTPDLQRAAARHGLRLGAHGVRDTETAARIIDLGVTAFTTDIPDKALALRRTALVRRLTGPRAA